MLRYTVLLTLALYISESFPAFPVYLYPCLPGLSGVPDAPDAPVPTNMHSDHCTVTWAPPKYDGGAPVTGYLLERQSNISPRWTRLTRVQIPETIMEVDDLMEGTEYQFRVYALNKKGESQPSQPSPLTLAKNPYGRLLLCHGKNLSALGLSSAVWLVSHLNLISL